MPSLEKSNQQNKSEFIGSTGTTIYGGYYQIEKLTELIGKNGLDTWDEMRRGDCQVKMVLNAIKNPIKSAQFEFDPGEGDRKAPEIADFLSFNWFDNPNFKFSKFLSEALTHLEFGYSIHEFFYSMFDHDDFGMVHILGGMGFRVQNTIEQFLISKQQGLYEIIQIAYGDTTDNKTANVHIPRKNIIILTNELEGDNYEGISLLRPCYGPWFRKNLYLKLNAIGNEKASIGIPKGKYPKGAETTTQKAEFINMLSNFAVHESAFMAYPDGYEVEVEKIQFDSEKLLASIAYEDAQMSKSMILQFLELGQNGNGGAFALGADQSDIALSSFQYIGDLIADAINEVSKEIVEMNYGKVDYIPLCKCSGINQKASKELADVVGVLIDKRIIKADPILDGFFRKIYNLPAADQNYIEVNDDNKGIEDQTTDNEQLDKNPQGKNQKEDKKIETSFSEKTGKKYRELTIYEKPINFSEIEKEMDFEKDRLYRTLKTRVMQISEKALRDLEIILKKNQDNRSGAVIDFQVNSLSLKKVLIEAMSDIVATGTTQADRDLKAKISSEIKLAETWKRNLEFLPKKVKNALLLQADQQSQGMTDKIKKIIAFGVSTGDDFNQTDKQIISDIETELEKYAVSSEIQNASGTITSQCINRGRQGFLFDQQNLEQIQAFQYSAIIDDATTDLCLSLDGKIFKPNDIESQRLMPPNHYNCRSILIPITINEPKPVVTGLDIDPTNPILIDEYKKIGKEVPSLEKIKKQRNL